MEKIKPIAKILIGSFVVLFLLQHSKLTTPCYNRVFYQSVYFNGYEESYNQDYYDVLSYVDRIKNKEFDSRIESYRTEALYLYHFKSLLGTKFLFSKKGKLLEVKNYEITFFDKERLFFIGALYDMRTIFLLGFLFDYDAVFG